MADTGDWRLAVQHDYLRGVELVRRAYRQYASNPGWDHDHCCFCSFKFMVPSPDSPAQVGYCTLNEYHWVCETCFRDFRGLFGWTVKEGRDAV